MKLGMLVETNSDVVRQLDTDFLNAYVALGNGTQSLSKRDGVGAHHLLICTNRCLYFTRHGPGALCAADPCQSVTRSRECGRLEGVLSCVLGSDDASPCELMPLFSEEDAVWPFDETRTPRCERTTDTGGVEREPWAVRVVGACMSILPASPS
jgi:hypothetical protein